jgi:hypothetical protein
VSSLSSHGLDQAKKLYKEFHAFEPVKIAAFHEKFRIPSRAFYVGEALEMFYTSDKLDPDTGNDDGFVSYVHEHEGGVGMYVTSPGSLRGRVKDVPSWISGAKSLVRLGDCEGYTFRTGYAGRYGKGKKVVAEATEPLPEWYAIPAGDALLVIQSKRTIIALLWGGNLRVEWAGVVG